MTWLGWLGLAVVLVIWAAVIWVLCRMLGRLDDDPDERDPYN